MLKILVIFVCCLIFGTNGKMVEIRSAEFANGANLIESSIVYGKYAFVANNDYISVITKIDLTTFKTVDQLRLNQSYSYLRYAFLSGHYGYFLTDTLPAQIIRLDLGKFKGVDNLILSEYSNSYLGALVGNYLYVSVSDADSLPSLLKVDINKMSIVSNLTFNDGSSLFIQVMGNILSFGSNQNIYQISLNNFTLVKTIPNGSYFGVGCSHNGTYYSAYGYSLYKYDANFNIVKSISLGQYYSMENALVIGNYAYFSGQYRTASVFKIDLTTFSIAKALNFSKGDIDPYTFFSYGTDLYFGFGTLPGKIVRVSANTLQITGELVLDSGYSYLDFVFSSGIYAYFVPISGILGKFDLDTWQFVKSLDLQTALTCAIEVDNYGYFCAWDGLSTSSLIKVDLSTMQTVITITIDTTNLQSAATDGKNLYIGGNGYGTLYKVDISSFTLTDSIYSYGSENIKGIIYNHTAYWVTHYQYKSYLVEFDLNTFTQVNNQMLDYWVIDALLYKDFIYLLSRTGIEIFSLVSMSSVNEVDLMNIQSGFIYTDYLIVATDELIVKYYLENLTIAETEPAPKNNLVLNTLYGDKVLFASYDSFSSILEIGINGGTPGSTTSTVTNQSSTTKFTGFLLFVLLYFFM